MKKKIIIYQVLPRLFGNDKKTNKVNGSISENGCGKLSAFDDTALNEIKKMGFTHIWYTGLLAHGTKTDYTKFKINKDHPALVKGNAGSPYAIKDYYDLDPDLADNVKKRMQEFEALTERTHQAGMKVIIDFVPNHVFRQYKSNFANILGTTDLGENDNIHTSFSKENDFYYMPGQTFSPEFGTEVNGIRYEEKPAKTTGNNRFDAHPTITDWYETVKLNYGVDYLGGGEAHFHPAPETWHKMLRFLLFWAGKKVDAFRCDMAEMVPVEFWNWAIQQVKEKYPSIDFIAEVYDPAQYRNYLHHGKFDYLYDKVGLYDTLRSVTCGFQPASDITSCWQSVNDIQPHMLNFLENHDEQRIASEFFAKDPYKAIPAMIISASLNTNPLMIYFGQELGEPGMDAEGFSGRDGRTTIFDYWSVDSIRNWRNKGSFDGKQLTPDQKKLKQFYSSLVTLCNKEKSIREGLFYDLMYVNFNHLGFNPEKQYAYFRQAGKELLLIVVNFDNQDSNLHIFLPGHAFEYFQLDPEKLHPEKELLSGEKNSEKIGRDQFYPVQLKANEGKILKFKQL